MPWVAADAKRHNKGLSGSQRKQWAAVANKVLAESGDEGKAIRIANGVVRKDDGSAPASRPTQTDVHVDTVNWKVPKKKKRKLIPVSIGPYITKDVGPLTDSTGNYLPSTARPVNMVDKSAASYVSPAPNPDQSCGSCTMFKSPSACSLVRGDIHPEDSCQYWTPQDAAANYPTPPSNVDADRLGAGSRPIPLAKILGDKESIAEDQGPNEGKYESTPHHFHQHKPTYHQSAKVWDFGGDTPTSKYGFKYHKLTSRYSPIDKGILPPTVKTKDINVNDVVFHTFQPKVFKAGVNKPPNKPGAPVSLVDMGTEGSKQHYFVIDGHHRISHARKFGPPVIPARIDRKHVTELRAIRGLGEHPDDFNLSKAQLKSVRGTFTSSYKSPRTPGYLTWCPQCQENLQNPAQFCPGCGSPTVSSMYSSGAPAPGYGLATLTRKNIIPLFTKDSVDDLHLPHQNRVGQAAKRQGLSPDAQVAGALHDVAERSDMSPDDVADHTSPRAANLIRALTHDKKEDYLKDYIPRIIAAGPEAVKLKLADITDNDNKKWDKFSAKKQAKHTEAKRLLNESLRGRG